AFQFPQHRSCRDYLILQYKRLPKLTVSTRQARARPNPTYGTHPVGSLLAYSAIAPGVVAKTLSKPGCFISACSACRTCASRNGWPVQNVCIEMPNTRDCFCDSRSISSN